MQTGSPRRVSNIEYTIFVGLISEEECAFAVIWKRGCFKITSLLLYFKTTKIIKMLTEIFKMLDCYQQKSLKIIYQKLKKKYELQKNSYFLNLYFCLYEFAKSLYSKPKS